MRGPFIVQVQNIQYSITYGNLQNTNTYTNIYLVVTYKSNIDYREHWTPTHSSYIFKFYYFEISLMTIHIA